MTPGGPIRVMLVDDSSIIRRLLGRVLDTDAGITVVGEAANGQIALDVLDELDPDIVILDIEMPVMDGLTTLPNLKRRRPTLPVIMFSTLTEAGAGATLDALTRGADDYVTKPSNTGSFDKTARQITAELVPKIKALSRRGGEPTRGTSPRFARPAPTLPEPGRAPGGAISHRESAGDHRPTSSSRPLTSAAVHHAAIMRQPARTAPRRPGPTPELVVIGVSTGGPTALASIIPQLPAGLPVPVLVTQHMPPIFTRLLAERLNAQSAVAVAEAVEGAEIGPGQVWIAAGGHHLVVSNHGGRLRLHLYDGPAVHSCKPAVDPMFSSAVAALGDRVLGVVLTGMGNDGLTGAQQIHDAGGRVLTQDEATSVVWGMPGIVARAGIAEQILPLDRVIPAIVEATAGSPRNGGLDHRRTRDRRRRLPRRHQPAGPHHRWACHRHPIHRHRAHPRDEELRPVSLATPQTAPLTRPSAPLTRPATAELSKADFDFVRQFVYKEAAITLDDGKEYLVTSRLTPLVRPNGASDLAGLIARLRANPTSALGGEVVDAMTTNETSFFRDVHPFESLRDHVLPELIRSRAAQRRLRIWCAASSCGQEPYTIALVIREHFPQLAGWHVEITGTDISPSMLAKGRAGEYSQLEVNRGLPAPMLVKHFQRRGARWALNDDVRRMVTFSKLNLAHQWSLTGRFDLVFMRNVLIYFDVPTKTQVLRQTRGKLADDGYLILGGAETTVGVDNDYQRALLGRSVWYRAI
jgi:two-component system, chemotaxis family, protein-glutamate methylesterase/glutaminase